LQLTLVSSFDDVKLRALSVDACFHARSRLTFVFAEEEVQRDRQVLEKLRQWRISVKHSACTWSSSIARRAWTTRVWEGCTAGWLRRVAVKVDEFVESYLLKVSLAQTPFVTFFFHLCRKYWDAKCEDRDDLSSFFGRLGHGDVSTSSTASTLKYCPWWRSRSYPFCQRSQLECSGLCLKAEKSTWSGRAEYSLLWILVRATALRLWVKRRRVSFSYLLKCKYIIELVTAKGENFN